MRRAWRNLRNVVRAWSFLQWSELPAYRRLLIGDGPPLVGLRVRTIGGRTVFARPNTADCTTLGYVFRDRYHLPPAGLPAAPVILDLGSNCGYTIVHYKHLHPDARVVGVELDADNLAVARRNVEGLRDVEVIHAAVSSRDGFVAYDKRGDEDSYRVTAPGGGEPSRQAVVQATSPPSLLRRFGLDRIDFAKIDIEGEELALFAAGNDLTWLDAVRSLNMEVHADDAACDALLATLRRHGFTAWRDDHHWSAIMAVKGDPPPTRGTAP